LLLFGHGNSCRSQGKFKGRPTDASAGRKGQDDQNRRQDEMEHKEQQEHKESTKLEEQQ